jgi:hypothetical protein
MKKTNLILIFAGLLILIAVLSSVIIFLASKDLTGNTINTNTNIQNQVVATGNAIQSDEVKWNHTNITWAFADTSIAGDVQLNRIKKAFAAVETETNGLIDFEQIEDANSADIKIYCVKGVISDQPDYYISGQAETTTQNNTIISANIYFYNAGKNNYAGGCIQYPDTEIHEILHALVIDHNEERNNIMNPVWETCPTSINQNLIAQLDNLYG